MTAPVEPQGGTAVTINDPLKNGYPTVTAAQLAAAAAQAATDEAADAANGFNVPLIRPSVPSLGGEGFGYG